MVVRREVGEEFVKVESRVQTGKTERERGRVSKQNEECELIEKSWSAIKELCAAHLSPRRGSHKRGSCN